MAEGIARNEAARPPLTWAPRSRAENANAAEPLLCWCCALWGLTVPAVCGRTRMCGPCLAASPATAGRRPCAERHMAQALAVGAGA